jgi:hypothetical protein
MESKRPQQDLSKPIELTAREADLIRYIRALPYGELTISIQASQPVRIERGVESVKLGV